MTSQILRPVKETLEISGKLSYKESNQCWNTIRLKKEILNEFPMLKEKRASFSYRMLLHRDYEELEKLIRKMKREKQPLPILVWLLRVDVI